MKYFSYCMVVLMLLGSYAGLYSGKCGSKCCVRTRARVRPVRGSHTRRGVAARQVAAATAAALSRQAALKEEFRIQEEERAREVATRVGVKYAQQRAAMLDAIDMLGDPRGAMTLPVPGRVVAERAYAQRMAQDRGQMGPGAGGGGAGAAVDVGVPAARALPYYVDTPQDQMAQDN